MKWSLLELEKYRETPLNIKETLDLKQSLQTRNADLLDVSPVLVTGLIALDGNKVITSLKVKVTLTLPSTRSLKPVTLPLDFAVSEIYAPAKQAASDEQSDSVIPLEDGSLNLDKAVEDNILLQIPLKILTTSEQQGDADMPKGSGWEVISEDTYNQRQVAKKKQVDPRFAQLKGLFDSNQPED
ncbi:nucleic acid-binding protein [Loigolactobacillus backii]|uniref:YceD family protein n=1 Tax=Loigolactobacillus backii TaxID=375175 RepID=UPI000C1CAE37|nr:DUF177 domain-containing protein [Loigolactobacillus backii]PIO83226.1 nucleic acid-binding protein [Loigolactobacillus backii]